MYNSIRKTSISSDDVSSLVMTMTMVGRIDSSRGQGRTDPAVGDNSILKQCAAVANSAMLQRAFGAQSFAQPLFNCHV